MKVPDTSVPLLRIPAAPSAAILFTLALLLPGSASGEDDKVLELGRLTYQTCVACHGPDGKGIQAGDLSMAPSLLDSPYLKGEQVELLTAVILKGIAKEDNRYVQAMLALEAALNNEQIAALIAYLTKEFGAARQTVRPADVGKWRSVYASQTSPWTRATLDEMLAESLAPKMLSNVTYRLYTGEWKQLPDFAVLVPDASGTLEDGLLSLDPATEQKHGFGMVFEADLAIPETGDYVFSLTSDDGSALVIDGETVVGNDGVHPARTVNMKEHLQEGTHSLQVLYFDAGGQRSLSLSVRRPTKDAVPVWLSTEKSEAKKAAQSYPPIPLTARNPGEAIVHRAFLPDAKPRAIAVGYPGAVNLVWDADVLNLAYVYQGEFIDASPHWNARGSGSKPLGGDRVKTAHGLPFQILESLDEAWVPFSEAQIRYERDSADPQVEITFDLKHPDYQFRGYRLDEKRFPTFRYDYRDLAVTDTFVPREEGGSTSLVRTLSIVGAAEENTYFRVANSGPLTSSEEWIDIGGQMTIRIGGADPIFRTAGEGQELLLPVNGDEAFEIEYRWSKPPRP